MDELDRRILTELQDNFPLAENPYDIMADDLGIGVDVLWRRVEAMVEGGVIRRMGFSIDSRKIGYTSTLAAVRVPAEQVQAASAVIAGHQQVTHSYLREDAFNIWFTVIAENAERIAEILEAIGRRLGLAPEDMMDLPAEKFYKLDTRFK